MSDWMFDVLLFAQEGANGAGAGNGNAQPSPWFTFMPLIVLFMLFYFLVMGPGRREQKRRKEMLSALKKNDRVLTQGGIIGTVANISSDGQKVTVKVDDNVRLPVLRSYIVTILTDDQSAEGEAKTS
ncbi:MAG: preprotein translocase subunit YajC [Planctomycetales bacterium]